MESIKQLNEKAVNPTLVEVSDMSGNIVVRADTMLYVTLRPESQ